MTKFNEIAVEEFPLNFEKYCRLRDQIRTAARGFYDLGTAAGYMVDKDLMDVYARLAQTWELIRMFERQEEAV